MCIYIFFCFVDDDELSSSSSSSSSGFFFRGIGFEPNDARQKLTFRAKILALLHVQSTETKVEAAKVATVATSTLGFAQSSFAAQPEEVVGNLAGIDGRIAIFFVFAPVLGWVAYNILGPGLNQLEDMQKKNSRRRGIAAGLTGLSAASLMAMPEQADAAEQVVGNLAGIDGRIAIFFVFAPVLGWVAYNILGPGLNQLEDMQKKNSRRRGIAAGLTGLSAASLMAMPEQADAAEQVVGNLAGIDGRIAIFFVFAPVLGWVAYNILGPGLSQLEDMQKKNSRRR